jgi:serine/threonine-protein kinase
MRLLTRTVPAFLLEEGAALGGYLVERLIRADSARELRYAVRGPDGQPATLLVSPRPFADRQERARFKRLARLRAEFSHPAAVEVVAFGEHLDHAYVVTEPYPERTLGDLIGDGATLEPERLLAMIAPVAAALDAAHRDGLVHQALGSETLILADGDRLLLDSFGIFESGQESAWWGVGRWGDLRYRPPEQLLGQPLEPSENVYSLAAVIVEALTGEPPYSGEPSVLAYSHLWEPPPSVSTRVAGLGPAIDDVTRRGLAKHPQDRPESATALVRQFGEALGIEVSPVAEAPRARAPSRRSLPVGTAFVAVAAVLGVLAAVVIQPLGDDARSATPGTVGAAVWKRLDTERSDLRARLAVAELPQEQADLAAQLAAGYDSAARALPAGARAREVNAARDAYARLAAAAEAGDESEFAAASDAVTRAERQLQTRR